MIANLRYALGVVAETLHHVYFFNVSAPRMPEMDGGNSELQNNTKESQDPRASDTHSPQSDSVAKDVNCEADTDVALENLPTTEREEVIQLLHTAKLICTTFSTSGPLLYLLKQIVRRFGFSFFRKIVKFYSWLVPKNLLWTGEV